MYEESCIFCKIAKGEVPGHIIWENEGCIAFLDVFPAVEGMTVVIPREHHSSHFADVKHELVCDLLEASREVAKLLDSKLNDVMGTKLVLEGLDVDHLHAKLYPMYEGRPTPDAGTRKATEDELRKVAERIRD